MIVRRQGPFNLNQRLNVCRKQIIQGELGARCSATGCSLNIVFFLWILWFFWTLPVLLQCWCLTYLCVQKTTIFNEHPVADSFNVRTNRQSEICRSGFAPKIIGPIVSHRKIPTIFFPFLRQWWRVGRRRGARWCPRWRWFCQVLYSTDVMSVWVGIFIKNSGRRKRCIHSSSSTCEWMCLYVFVCVGSNIYVYEWVCLYFFMLCVCVNYVNLYSFVWICVVYVLGVYIVVCVS